MKPRIDEDKIQFTRIVHAPYNHQTMLESVHAHNMLNGGIPIGLTPSISTFQQLPTLHRHLEIQMYHIYGECIINASSDVTLNEPYFEKNHSTQWSENLRAILHGFTHDGEVQIKFH